jgi:cobalt-zinc-cadmium resistance protein CzcA
MFAIVGALILSLTYVPMMSSLVLSKRIIDKKSISDRIMESISRIYRPMFFAVLRRQRLVISIIVVFLMLSIVLFSRLGAEFIPNLDEGDFAVEMRLMPGASLTNTIAKTEQASKVLLENFSEVKKVVGKIGTAEIPTDPMPMEACDLMIILKDKSQWKNAESKEDLAELMKKTLERTVPGVDFGFQQPIQMRFNELMTGAKQDVVVKIYGEDFTMLENYAQQIGKIALKIKGVEDLYVEQLEGLPQLIINYNRSALAHYGVSIEEVNEAVNAGFAGSSAGFVYEGEKRFSLVVRLDSMYRVKTMDLKDIFVDSKTHAMIPITELATISYESGLNQIQRDDAKRRVLVGFNVRGRDVKSVVDELKLKVNQHIAFSPGYNFTVGGSFKNLEEASARLLIAVPAALLLIFFLLYMTFNSLKQALMIFTAIPLASIGGIWALFIRDMPFSISAGIGFIALFGVAVLNGIVLITEYNTLKSNGEDNRLRIVIKGTLSRLRPVLLTATVASLGFLPMALSHGSGAEVQKPLATVVIGGLISATFLTLFFLPILYFLLSAKTRVRFNIKAFIPMILLVFSNQLFAQQTRVSDLIKHAVSMNPELKADSLFILQAKPEALAMVQINKLDVNAMIGQYNSNYRRDNNFSIQQIIPFPTAFKHAKSLGVELAKERMLSYEYKKLKFEEEVAKSIEQWLYLTKKHAILLSEDSTLMSLETQVSMRVNSGETNGLDSWLLASEHLLIQQQVVENKRMLIEAQTDLVKRVFLSDAEIESLAIKHELFVLDSLVYGFNPYDSPQWKVSNQSLKTIAQEYDLQRSLSLPDIQLGYFNQTLVGNIPLNGGVAPFTSADRFQGGSIGLSIPLLSRSSVQRNQWLMLESERIKYDLVKLETATKAEYNSLIAQYNSYKMVYDQLQRRVDEVTKGVNLIANTQVEQGEIDQITWLNLKRNLVNIQLTELDMKHQLNLLIVQIRYLNSNKK